MRTSLSAFALAIATLCSAVSQAHAQRRGGDLVFAISSEPNTYDCHALASSVAMQALAPHYSTLLRFDPARYPEIQGDVAESWTAAPDGMSYSFALRRGIRFHDGSVLTSADVKATFDRLRNPPQGAVSVRRATFADIASIETPDENTVVFRMARPNASMMAVFASPWNCIYSAARLGSDPAYPARAVMGTGAFEFVRHENGAQWIGRRFEGYFRADRPFLDGYRAVLFPSSSAMVNAMQGGQIMVDFRGLTPSERSRLTTALGERVAVDEMPEITHVMFTFNSSTPPFDDPRVRRALSLAVDRWGGQAGFQRGTRLGFVGGVMRPGSAFATPPEELARLPGFGRDMNAARAEARRLLQDAGRPNLSFVLTNRNFSPFTEVATYLIDQWRRIGVTVEHRPVENAAWASALGNGSFEAILDFSAEFVDEPAFGLIKYISHDRSPASAARFVDRRLDELYDGIVRTVDQPARLALLRQFEQRLFEQSYSVPVFWAQRIIARHSYVRGWTMTPNGPLGQDLVDVWLDR